MPDTGHAYHVPETVPAVLVGDPLRRSTVASMFGFQGTKQRTLRTKMAVQRVVQFERGASTIRTSVHDGIERCGWFDRCAKWGSVVSSTLRRGPPVTLPT